MDNPNSVQVVIQFAIVLVVYFISKMQLIFIKIRVSPAGTVLVKGNKIKRNRQTLPCMVLACIINFQNNFAKLNPSEVKTEVLL